MHKHYIRLVITQKMRDGVWSWKGRASAAAADGISGYENTTSPTPSIPADNVTMAVGTWLGWQSMTFDVEKAYSNKELPKHMKGKYWLKLPSWWFLQDGSQVGDREMYCEVDKCLYGYDFSGHLWHDMADEILATVELLPCKANRAIYVRKDTHIDGGAMLSLITDDGKGHFQNGIEAAKKVLEAFRKFGCNVTFSFKLERWGGIEYRTLIDARTGGKIVHQSVNTTLEKGIKSIESDYDIIIPLQSMPTKKSIDATIDCFP